MTDTVVASRSPHSNFEERINSLKILYVGRQFENSENLLKINVWSHLKHSKCSGVLRCAQCLKFNMACRDGIPSKAILFYSQGKSAKLMAGNFLDLLVTFLARTQDLTSRTRHESIQNYSKL